MSVVDPSPLDRVLGLLQQPRRAGDGWVARCPAHEDRHPSLSVGEGAEGRVLLNCHAGCALDAILAALQLTERDLFPEPVERHRGRDIVATYSYVDEGGAELFQVVRFHPKDFRQRRPDGHGGWLWNLQGTRRVLYRLPQVREAIERGDTTWLCEGERDVHALERAGVVATTMPGGAGKWKPDYTLQLAGAAEVVIVADRDDTGRQHAAEVASVLTEHGIPVRVVEPASGKDATDHFAAGHTLDELRLGTPEHEHGLDSPDAKHLDSLGDDLEQPQRPLLVETWVQFRDAAEDEISCLVEGIWPEGSLGFIASAPKKGKTWLGLSLALSVATGRAFLGQYAIPGARPVYYLALEGHRTALVHRIGALARGLGVDPSGPDAIGNLHLSYRPRGINLADPAWVQHLLDAVEPLDAALVVVDVLRAGARIRENEASDFADLRATLQPLLDEGRSIALLHHFTKLSEISKERTPAERMSGSGAMYGAMDVGVFITGSDDHARRLRVAFEARDLTPPDDQGVILHGTGTGHNGGFSFRDAAHWMAAVAPDDDSTLTVSAEEIADWVRVNGGDVKASDVRAAFGPPGQMLHPATLRRRLTRLSELGIEYVANPHSGKPARLVDTLLGVPDQDPGQPDQLDLEQTLPLPDHPPGYDEAAFEHDPHADDTESVDLDIF
jgi:hypothetical protein